MNSKKNLVIAIYSLPDYYPPTLNAIEYLSGQYDSISILHRNLTGSSWNYPPNVRLITPKKLYSVKEVENANIFKKIFWFLQFTLDFFSVINRVRPDTILIYDSLPVLSYQLFHSFIKRPKILWYHNHDVIDPQYVRKWSISWLAWKTEKWIFPKLNIFSLPSIERRDFFPVEKLKGKFFFLPNFPSLLIYNKYKVLQNGTTEETKILFQGSIGPLHGLEEIIGILNTCIKGKTIKLFLKGFISDAYKSELLELSAKYGVSDKIIFLPPTGYSKVIENAQTCHIGIGIHKKQDIMNKTLGTSSNKIYEYAASGLPVLLFDNAHFRNHLGQYKWAFFTDCTKVSLIANLEKIILNYPSLSNQARLDFEDKLNFENFIHPVIGYLQNIQIQK